MDYFTLKLIHQTAVALSFCGFVARGAGSLAGAAWVRGRAARSLPHLVDSVLLLSALTLAFILRLDPVNAPWLLAKLTALMVYIGLGIVALRPSFPLRTRAIAWVAALLTFGYMVSAAITKSPLGVFAG
ncbi:MAG: SirB2 family protein [Rhizobacter sp.]|jgi:uncharacterized membrane protein SirB2